MAVHAPRRDRGFQGISASQERLQAGYRTDQLCLIESAQDGQIRDVSTLVTTMTDPDWVPMMKRDAAIITDHVARISHAAIVIGSCAHAVIGTNNAMYVQHSRQDVTVSCTEGDQG